MPSARIRSIENSHVAILIRIGEDTGLSPWSAQNYFDELKNPNAIMLRLEDEGNATVAFIVGRVVMAADDAEAVDAEIYNIAVEQRGQRQGSGQLLLDEFIARCGALNIRKIWLEVRSSNQKAIEFYTRNGFIVIETRRMLYSNPQEDGLVMTLSL